MAARRRGQAPPLRSILPGGACRSRPLSGPMPTSARPSGPPASSGRVWAPAPTHKRHKVVRRERNPGSRGGPCGRPRAGTSPAPTGRSVPSGGTKGAAASAARAQGVKCILGRHRLCSGSRYSGRLEIRAAPDVKKPVPRRGRRGTGLLYSLTFSGSRPRLRTWQPWRRRPPWRRRWPGCRP